VPKMSSSHKPSASVIVTSQKNSTTPVRSSFQLFTMNYSQSNAPPSQPLPPVPARADSKQSPLSTSRISHFPSEPPPRPRPVPMLNLPDVPTQNTIPIISPKARSRADSRSTAQQQYATPEARAYSPHPFGNELAQVTELAEEYSGGQITFPDEEGALMAHRGLFRFEAEDYMIEIQGYVANAFGNKPVPVLNTPVASIWI